MKKRLLILLICLLSFSQIFAVTSVHISATLGLKDDNRIGLKRVNVNAQTTLIEDILDSGLNYSFLYNPDLFVEDHANTITAYATVASWSEDPAWSGLTYRLQVAHSDASTINSKTKKVTKGPVWTIENTLSHRLNTIQKDDKNFNQNYMLGTSFEFRDRDLALQSYFGRYSFDCNEKYMLQGTARYDMARFTGQGFVGRLFPSVSAGYVMTEEDWFNMEECNFLKFRASYGLNGDATYSDTWKDWGVSRQFDLGVDTRWKDSEIGLSEDFFVKNTVNEDANRLFYGNELSASYNTRTDKNQNHSISMNTAFTFEKLADRFDTYATEVGVNYAYSYENIDFSANAIYKNKAELEENEKNGITSTFTLGYTKPRSEVKYADTRVASIVKANFYNENGTYLPDVSIGGTVNATPRETNRSFNLNLDGYYYILNNSGYEKPADFNLSFTHSGYMK